MVSDPSRSGSSRSGSQLRPAGFDASLAEALGALSDAGLRRTPPTVHGVQGPEVEIAGRRVLCLCSNNYLGLASHPSLAAAAAHAAHTHGVGAGASRLVSGTMAPHRDAEAALAAFVGAPAARLFSSGYAANAGALAAFAEPGDVIFSDALNHASLIDGARLSRARVVVYPHGDTRALAAALAEARPGHRRALIVTESVFSMDGDLAPLAELRALADAHNAALYVDEAHALGVLGPGGAGALAALGVSAEVVVGTLGKAFGAFGAFVAASESAAAWLDHRARAFVFSTAPPPLLGPVAVEALALVAAADDARAQLAHHARALRRALGELGFPVRSDASPIIPVVLGDPRSATEASERLLAEGVFVQAIRPPTVPEGTSRLRIVPMATHTEEQIRSVTRALALALKDAPRGAHAASPKESRP